MLAWPEQLLDGPEVGPGIQHVRRAGVPEGMDPDTGPEETVHEPLDAAG